MNEFQLKKRYSNSDLQQFADIVNSMQEEIDFKVSARGWAYLLEGRRLINKDQFDKVATLINDCRKKGFLPIDFVAEESARQFNGVVHPDKNDVIQDAAGFLRGFLNAPEHYNPDWWDGEEYYIQMVVEKIDLVTLFQPICEEYFIPIANAKGWSSILQRAEYSRRFKEAQKKGLKCVLLYCGDHDPDGLRISEFIRKNLEDVSEVQWGDGTTGYNPADLIIERFGLNYDFIQKHNLTWIDNLITGSSKNLASPAHKNHMMPYVQAYLKTIGERKCEANAVITMPDAARKLVRDVIEAYLGVDALGRFEAKREAVRAQFKEFMERSGLDESIEEALRLIDEE
ncbi:MAG TPA: hypothetical protein VFJ43_06810 [Bacteroidia bacterium]|nr:hypothetical protein [Bacteroidia bacterium]